MSDLDLARYARERGEILRTLKEDYSARMTSMLTLLRALDVLGVSLAPEGLGFHLQYLEEQGYVRVWRAKDMPGYRRDRASSGRPDDIKFAKLSAKGLQLIDGLIVEDPAVAF